MDEQAIAGLRPQWEHHIEYIRANGLDPQLSSFNRDLQTSLQRYYPGQRAPIYAVQAILPRLNELGEQGWELVNMEPVVVGVNGDINPGREQWTNTYLCAFKRLKRSANQLNASAQP